MKELKSREGYYLTQVGEVGEERIFISAIKGLNINEEYWKEVTAQEKEEWEKAHEVKDKE